MQSPAHTPRITRRRLLLLLGGSAAGASLLATAGNALAATTEHARQAALSDAVAAVLGPVAVASAAEPLAGFQAATQAGFSPIDSSLTFGVPTDLAAGWDGTAWAIDDHGAPYVYDSLSNTWQLHGTGIDAAVSSIPWLYPAVYFKGSEVWIADGQHSVQPIASVWPNLPRSYQLGVNGAFPVQQGGSYKLVLIRSGTYLTVPAPQPAPGVSAPPATSTPTPDAVVTPVTATPTPHAATTPVTATPAVTPTPHRLADGAAGPIYHTAMLAAATTTPSAAPTHTAQPASSPTSNPTVGPSHTPSPTALPITTPTVTPSPSVTTTSVPTHTPTPTPSGSQTPTPTPTPAAASAATSTPTQTAVSTPTPAPDAGPSADYVPMPLNTSQGWPQTANWREGIIDAVFDGFDGTMLIRGGEFVEIGRSPGGGPLTVMNGPAPVANLPGLPN
ncbi:MAG TPA: hypothetical protein VGJ60_23000, partial [Chloroflexota bacterium]